jgi:uncharacterized protein
MSQENVEIVRRMYEAWNRSRGTPPFELIDPGIELEVSADGPIDGTYRGHAGVSEFLDGFWSNFDEHRIDVVECISAGRDVIAILRYYGRGRASGAEVDGPGSHVWTLRDGKAVRWRILTTRAEALEAVGLSERDAHEDS